MRLSADLEVAGLPVAVCGAAPSALGVIGELLAAAAVITVVAAAAPATIADLADRGLITWHRRPWSVDDLGSAALVVPAGATAVEDAAIMAAARAAGRLCLAPAASSRPPTNPNDPTTQPSPPGPPAPARHGQVTLVGAGPGDPRLITVAGLDAVRTADVIICDRLVPLAVLSEAPSGVEVIDVAKIPRGRFTAQQEINRLLIEHARTGRRVVRLKGGDSFVFGRGGEEVLACAEAGVPVKVIPGVSSATAAPALAGIPLTHRSLTQGVTIVSAHVPPGHPTSTLDWAALARANTTLVILMGVATLPEVTAELLVQGMGRDTPAATVADAGMASQRTVRGTVATIAAATREAGLRPPAVTVIGAVAGLGD